MDKDKVISVLMTAKESEEASDILLDAVIIEREILKENSKWQKTA